MTFTPLFTISLSAGLIVSEFGCDLNPDQLEKSFSSVNVRKLFPALKWYNSYMLQRQQITVYMP